MVGRLKERLQCDPNSNSKLGYLWSFALSDLPILDTQTFCSLEKTVYFWWRKDTSSFKISEEFAQEIHRNLQKNPMGPPKKNCAQASFGESHGPQVAVNADISYRWKNSWQILIKKLCYQQILSRSYQMISGKKKNRVVINFFVLITQKAKHLESFHHSFDGLDIVATFLRLHLGTVDLT